VHLLAHYKEKKTNHTMVKVVIIIIIIIVRLIGHVFLSQRHAVYNTLIVVFNIKKENKVKEKYI
jgi:hypothetical protein